MVFKRLEKESGEKPYGKLIGPEVKVDIYETVQKSEKEYEGKYPG